MTTAASRTSSKGGSDDEGKARKDGGRPGDARADLASQEQNLRTLQLRTEQEQATLENARTDLSKVRIESPIDGIITRRNVEQGETAVVGTMNNAGTVLLQVADMSVIEAEVEVDETDIPNVQLGQTG